MDALRQLFIGSLNFAVAASWLIAVILLLRPLLKKFAPKWVLCGLWAFVAIRLVCPVMLHSDVSVYRLAGDAVQSSGQVTYFQDTGFCGDVRYRPATLLPGASSSAVMPSTAEDPAPEGSVDAAAQTRAPSRFVGMNIPAIVWAAGIYIMAMAALASYLSLRSRVAASIPLEGNVYLCDNIKSPFILGVLQPRIYLTSGMDEAARDCVLRHERAHLRRWDHVWKPLGFVLLAVYWYDPLVWAAYILFCRDMELACDERVIRDMAAEERAVYSQALLDCSRGRHWVAACPLAFGEVGVKTRVKAVLWYKKPGYWISAAAVLVCAAVAVCFLTNPRKQEESDLSLANYQNVATLAAQTDYVTVTQSDGTVTTIPGTVLSRLLSSADWMYQAADEPDDALDNKYALMVQVDDSTAIRFYDGEPMEGARITAGDEIRWYYMGDMHVSDAAQALVQTDPLLLKLAAQADDLDTFDIGWVEGDILYPDDDIPAPVLSRFLRSLDWQPMEDITTEIFNRSGYQEVARLVLGDSTMHFYEVPDTPEEAVVIHSGGTDYFYTVLNGFRGWLTGDGRYLGRADQKTETYTFGSYEQDGDTANGKEPIEWLVLDRDGDKALLLSKYALDYQSFMPFYEPVTEHFTWESSTLRQWLNSTFLNSAFSADEQQRLLTTTVITSPGSLHRSDGLITTEDRVFLLSNTEVYAYFANEAATAAEYTVYALSANPWAGSATAPGAADWWLRTTDGSDHPDGVYAGGRVGEGTRAYEGEYVRPAIWVTMPE